MTLLSKAGIAMSGAELKADARSLIRGNAPRLILIGVIYIIILSVIAVLQFRLPIPGNAYNEFLEQLSAGVPLNIQLFFSVLRPYWFFLTALLGIITPVISIGYANCCLKTARNEISDYNDLKYGFSMVFKIILMSLITKVFILLWSLLFFFPGMAAYYKYRQAYYILLDDPGKGIKQCLSESQLVMKGRKLDLFLIDLSFMGWVAAPILAAALLMLLIPAIYIIPLFPIICIWLTPYYNLTKAAYYNHILKEVSA